MRAPSSSHQLTRFVLLRGLALIYLVAFLIVIDQGLGLMGENGILPVSRFLPILEDHFGGRAAAIWNAPSLLWLSPSDGMLLAIGWVGAALALAALLGVTNAWVMAALFIGQLSLTHTGQVFWGYGWELLLVEAGFLAIFLCPAAGWRPFPALAPSRAVIWLFRWLAFRVMFGAGLIKLRGDACWTELDCLVFHYETQPNPHPLSPWLHRMPEWFHAAGVLFNHLVELVVPFGLFGPRRVRHVAGALLVVFQVTLIVSGNLSFLNWLTLVVCLSAFDDTALARLPRLQPQAALRAPGRLRRGVTWALVGLVAVLSIEPTMNLFSPGQRMNASFDPWGLVNTYGAFGSVDRERIELVIEGTGDDPDDPDAEWAAYELPCKPGDPHRAPCWVTPYHYRLDWQMWFAWRQAPARQPWVLSLLERLLAGAPEVLDLFSEVPFEKPRAVRVLAYTYRFADPGADAWWTREPMAEWIPPISADDPELTALLERMRFSRAR